MNKHNQFYDNTIAAIATPHGYGGISVIRISGESAFRIADRLLGENAEKTADRQHGTFFHTTIYDPNSREHLDDALVLVFHAPKSYTGENTVEIQGHGGFIPAERLLNAALKAGAKLAEPGEFTKRAFLNGNIDLTQAEAVCDLIQSQTERAAAAARAQLDGLLGADIRSLYDEIVEAATALEHLLDFEEGEIADAFVDKSIKKIEDIQHAIEMMISTWHDGELLRQGVMIVLSGPPNAGKSSLLNALLKRNRAIVHNTPGTTRDVIEESYSLKGVPIRLVDTAGLRDSGNAIECEGMKRAHALIEQADINLLVVDKTQYSKESIELLLKEFDLRKLILVLNKNDIADEIKFDLPENIPAVDISALTGDNIEKLKNSVIGKLEIKDVLQTQPFVTQRHREELQFAGKSLGNASEVLQSGLNDIVLAAGSLREGAEALGRITGRIYSEDLLDNIFSKFCVGK